MATVTATTDDLTTMQVDVVVNAANEGLQHGGGVAAALARAGGRVVQAESDEWVAANGPLGVGSAATTTAGAMPAGHVVHVVGPRWSGRAEDPDHLAAAVLAALDAAVAVDAGSIALPVISAGIFGYPLDDAAHVIAVTARTWASAHDNDDIAISLVGVDDQATQALAAGLAHDPLSGWPTSAPRHRDRPVVPDGYGVPDGDEGLQDWAVAEGRLAAADTMWLATTRPDGRPHVVPRWGVWLDNQLYYDGAPTTRHVRNLVADGASGPAALHLESGTDVVIVNGSSGPTTPPTTWRGVQLVAAFHAKYKAQGYAPGLDAWAGEAAGGLCRFVPSDALAWANFPTDVTRWRF